jgi:hypothetical protein
MRRVGTILIAVGAVFVFGMFVNAGEEGIPDGWGFLVVAGLLVGTGAGMRFTVSRQAQGTTRDGWSAGSTTDSPAGQPERRHRRGRAAWSLGRVECREMVGSPWFGVGVGLALLVLVMFGLLWSGDFAEHWWVSASALTLAVHPFVGLVVVASHRSVTRARRDGCEELFASCPVDEGDRLTANLVPALIAAPIAAGTAIGLFAITTSQPAVYGELDLRVPLLMATCGVLGAGAVALGVALGRWAPFFLAPAIALVAILALDDRLLDIGGARWTTDRYLATFDPGDGPDQLLTDLPVAERLVWFAALAVLVAALALLGRRRWAVPLGAVAAAAALLAAAAVTAPMSDPDALVGPVIDPSSHETCVRVTTAAEVEVCAPTEYRGAVHQYAAGLAPTVEALGDLVDEPVRLRMRLVDEPIDELPAELAGAIPTELSLDDGAIPFSTSTQPYAIRAARYRLVASSLGLPIEADGDDRPTVVAGTASGLAILWLGTLGMEPGERRDVLTVKPDDHAHEVLDATVFGQLWPDPCTDGPAPLTWSPEDAEGARRMVAAAHDDVLGALHERWDELQRLTTDDLLLVAGLEPVGRQSTVERRPHVCPY